MGLRLWPKRYKSAFERAAADRDRLAADRDRLAEEAAACRLSLGAAVADRDRLAALLSEAVNPLDAGFFRLDLLRFGVDPIAPDDLQFVEDLAKHFEHGAHGELIASLLSRANVRIAHVLGVEYFEAFSAYYLACLFVAQNRLDRAMPYTERLGFDAPPDGTDFLPHDLRQGTRLARYQQDAALGRGAPGAVIVSLQKSASAFLSTALATIFEIPVLKIALGEGPRALVVRKWADQIARGGAVTHEHFQACKENIDTLRQSKIDSIWLQVRDPRDAAFSLMRMAEVAASNGVNPNMPGGDEANQFEVTCRRLGCWLGGWLAAAECHFPDLAIKVITYSEVTKDFKGVFYRLFGQQMTDSADSRIKEVLRPNSLRPNFRNGNGEEWRSRYRSRVAETVWTDLPDNVKSFLCLEP